MLLNDKPFQFKRRLTRLDTDFQRLLGRVLRSPNAIDYKYIIEDYLHILRNRFPAAFFSILNLQNHLLMDIDLAEKSIKHFKELKKNTKESSEIDTLDKEIFVFELFRNKLKDIGDALAWKLFDYNRAVLYLFSNNPDPGYLNHVGLTKELLTFIHKSFEKGNISILNIISNCLRIGDLISKSNEGTIEIEEIKSSGNLRKDGKERLSRQLNIMDELVSFLNENKSFDKGKESRMLTIDIYPLNYFKELKQVIGQAYNKGYSTIKINEYSFIDVFNYNRLDDYDAAIKYMEEQHEIQAPGWDNNTAIFSNYDRFSFSPVIAPYSIFPLSEQLCADIMFGQINISIYLNFTELAKYLEQKGLKVIETTSDIIKKDSKQLANKIMVIKYNNMYLNLPPMTMNKIFYEYYHPNYIVKEIKLLREVIKEGEEPGIIIYNKQEKHLWH
jgi:hypothetical protein